MMVDFEGSNSEIQQIKDNIERFSEFYDEDDDLRFSVAVNNGDLESFRIRKAITSLERLRDDCSDELANGVDREVDTLIDKLEFIKQELKDK